MRYYLSFEIPANPTTVQEYHVNGIGFDFSSHPDKNVKTDVITVKNKGQLCLKVDDNSVLKLQKTHTVFIDKMRVRPDGSTQGYLVIETVPIDQHGGSINVIVTKVQ